MAQPLRRMSGWLETQAGKHYLQARLNQWESTMDLVVLVMVISIYTGAIAAPLALFILARRTGHGPAWQAAVAVCAAMIWVAIILGFLREFLDVAISRDLLELAGLAAVLSFAVLALLALVMVTKAWPERTEPKDTRYAGGRLAPVGDRY